MIAKTETHDLPTLIDPNYAKIIYFQGLPDYGVAPFDPHYCKYVEQRRGDARAVMGYRLILSDVYEYGWENSTITKFRTDWENNRIVYSQYFGDKSLKGNYDFKAKVLGQVIHNKGRWNLKLGDYSQTTSITRTGGPGSLLKVKVEVDRIGKMTLHISDMFRGQKQLEQIVDFFINAGWPLGLPFFKPLINDLVSTAFTDIFNDSFRNFPVEEMIPE